MSGTHRSPLFMPIIYVGGLIFGFGLAISGMARPEVVLDFLQFEDFGLLFVMGGAAIVTGITFAVATGYLDRAPLTASEYTRRVKEFDRNVVVGGAIFGVGWGLSGICPGAAYASVGIGNYPILWAVVGMFIGAYAQGYWRALRSSTTDDVTETASS
ncbi:YeeE/YedE family protein [Haloterrigena salifodinae]|uniref:YeeE/YedE family protein n=1 Tax=Haloterrigena salifodinae TaxID=2675099 RepID=A0A8T8DWU3_9EURY|nr:YeeE/YedE family protein [Haloterrigena salifodinae]QRV13566.1 YeeE/YedE family protein [Haloterrigena salifodinae]